MRLNTNHPATWLHHLNAQHIFAQPRGRSGSPTMTQAVPKALITIGSKLSVNISHTRRHQLVDRRRTRQPIQIKILPKCCRAQIKHRAPILPDPVERTLIIPGSRHCPKHVITIKSGKAFGAIHGKITPISLNRIHQPGECQQGGRLLRSRRVRSDTRSKQRLRHLWSSLDHPSHDGLALIRQLTLTQHLTQFATSLHRTHHQSLQTRVDRRRIRVGWPIQETVSIQSFHTVCPNLRDQMTKQSGQIRFLVLQIIQISLIIIPIPLDQQPPNRIRADPVHPSGQWRDITSQIETLRNHLVITEDRVHRHYLGMQIAHPDQTVALDAIPKIFLHIQMNGIGARPPNLIQTLVVTTERAPIRNIPKCRDRPDLLEA